MKDIHLHKPKVFDQRFREHFKICDTYIQAYKETEKDYKAIWGENKYSSYNSFRNAYNARQRK